MPMRSLLLLLCCAAACSSDERGPADATPADATPADAAPADVAPAADALRPDAFARVLEAPSVAVNGDGLFHVAYWASTPDGSGAVRLAELDERGGFVWQRDIFERPFSSRPRLMWNGQGWTLLNNTILTNEDGSYRPVYEGWTTDSQGDSATLHNDKLGWSYLSAAVDPLSGELGIFYSDSSHNQLLLRYDRAFELRDGGALILDNVDAAAKGVLHRTSTSWVACYFRTRQTDGEPATYRTLEVVGDSGSEPVELAISDLENIRSLRQVACNREEVVAFHVVPHQVGRGELLHYARFAGVGHPSREPGTLIERSYGGGDPAEGALSVNVDESPTIAVAADAEGFAFAYEDDPDGTLVKIHAGTFTTPRLSDLYLPDPPTGVIPAVALSATHLAVAFEGAVTRAGSAAIETMVIPRVAP